MVGSADILKPCSTIGAFCLDLYIFCEGFFDLFSLISVASDLNKKSPENCPFYILLETALRVQDMFINRQREQMCSGEK